MELVAYRLSGNPEAVIQITCQPTDINEIYMGFMGSFTVKYSLVGQIQALGNHETGRLRGLLPGKSVTRFKDGAVGSRRINV